MRSFHLKIIAIALLGILGLLALFEFGGGTDGGGKPYSVHGADAESATDLDGARENAGAGTKEGELPEHGSRVAVLPTDEESALVPEGPPDLSLRGRVLSSSGAPLAGARVLLEPKQDWLTLPLGVEPVPGIQSWRAVEETLTDEEGRFAFEEVTTGSYVLEAYEEEHRPSRVDKLGFTASLGLDIGDVKLELGAVVHGRVYDSRGQGVAGALLLESLGKPSRKSQTAIPGRGRPAGETDASGQFRLANLVAGDLFLIVDSPEHLPTEVEAVAVERDAVSEELIVHLDTGYPLEGRIEGVARERLERLRVVARRRDTADSDSAPPVTSIESRPRTVACDASGKFRLAGLSPGKDYRLTAFEVSDDEGETLARLPEIDPVYARPGDVGVVLGLKLTSRLRFRIVDDTTGEPVTSFVARAGFESLESLKLRGKSKLEHAGGVVLFDRLRRTEDSTTAQVEVRALGYSAFSQDAIELKAGEEKDLGEVRLTPAPRLLVTVKDAETGKFIRDAFVYVGKTESKQEMQSQADAKNAKEAFFGDVSGSPVDDHGVAALELITGEASLVLVSANGYATFEFPEQNFDGTEDVTLAASLSRGGEVTVQVVDSLKRPVEGVTVLFRRLDEDFTNEWLMLKPEWATDGLGKVVFRELSQGEYGFRLESENESGSPTYANVTSQDDWTRVTVEDGTMSGIELTTHSRSKVFGVVYEGGVPLADADLTLVAIVDGEPVRRRRNRMYFGSSGADPNRAQSDENGRYQFQGIKAGEFLIRVSHATRYMTTEVPVTILLDPTEADLRLSIASIEGRITDLEGSPLQDIRVRADTDSGARRNDWSAGGLQLGEDEEGSVSFSTQRGTSFNAQPSSLGTRTDSDGRYVIRGVRTDEVINLTISNSLWSRVAEELDPLSRDEIRRDVDFAMTAAGVLQCDFPAMPPGVDRFSVAAKFVGEGTGESASRSVRNWDRKARMNSLSPGLWKVEVRLRDGTVLRTFESEVVAGEVTRVTVEFQ